jgi:hypothetical protein
MDHVLRTAVSREWFQTLLLALFATLALVLACVGYTAYLVCGGPTHTRDRRAMALGAQPVDVLGSSSSRECC